MISLTTYLVYAFIAVPLAISMYHASFNTICPLIKCIRPLTKCLQEPPCNAMLDCMATCGKEDSENRREAAQKFHYVQFPENPALCRYLCFDTIATSTAEDFISCVGGSGCVEPAAYSDVCPSISSALSFKVLAPDLAGRWEKLYTSGWDTWPCQSTEFLPPGTSAPPPEPWMTAWPTDPNVWRMNLQWKTAANYTISMCNELYANQAWDFSLSQPPTTTATAKTRAVMWGTEAHENWYLLEYNADTKIAIIFYCAYTLDVEGFDAMVMVIRKETSEPFTAEMGQVVERRVKEIMGEKYGVLQRIKSCNL
jgi:hypothetical protein